MSRLFAGVALVFALHALAPGCVRVTPGIEVVVRLVGLAPEVVLPDGGDAEIGAAVASIRAVSLVPCELTPAASLEALFRPVARAHVAPGLEMRDPVVVDLLDTRTVATLRPPPLSICGVDVELGPTATASAVAMDVDRGAIVARADDSMLVRTRFSEVVLRPGRWDARLELFPAGPFAGLDALPSAPSDLGFEVLVTAAVTATATLEPR